ncbi:MAG: SIS domain-containing protein [Planctomycetes bacterium]|nr:SIS domain-containing protein [Planctomycetota bacterium]
MRDFDRLVSDSITAIQSLRAIRPQVERAGEMIATCLGDGHKLLVCGNGGSAADASHMATEFVVRFVNDRKPFPALALVESGPTLTAILNDYPAEVVFARQVHAFAQPGDVLIAITTSGKSRNIVLALEAAREVGITSIGMLGRDGGACRGLATLDLIVPGSETARIQEAHKVLIHALCELVEPTLQKKS